MFSAALRKMSGSGFPFKPRSLDVFPSTIVSKRGDRLVFSRMNEQFLLEEAKLAVVPFSAFGASKESNWYRLSVGTATERDVQEALHAVEKAITILS